MNETETQQPDADEDEQNTSKDSESDRELGNSLDVGLGDEEGEGLDDPEEPDANNNPKNTIDSGSTRNRNHNTTSSTRSKSDQDHNIEDLHRVFADSPMDGRESLNIYIGSEDKQRLRQLEQQAEQHYDNKVFKIDVYLAALRAGLHDENAFFAEMDSMGYDYIET